jgi:long-chain fatty acid transport protein
MSTGSAIRWSAAILLLARMLQPVAAFGQGITISGVGPVNSSMGGAAVAAPVSACGALYWNPATITDLGSTELEVGLHLLYASAKLSSTYQPNSLGPGVPNGVLSGSTRSDGGVSPLPETALVFTTEDPKISFGLGVFTAGGFSVNYPGSTTNPILTAQAPHGFGLGPLYTELIVIQIVPTVAVKLTDQLSVGFAPTVNMGKIGADPLFLASPDDANHDGFATYESGTNGRYEWGLGFQAGVFYTINSEWSVGASAKSPQWFEPFRLQSLDEAGQPRTLKVHFDYPMILSVGGSYAPMEDLLVALDFHYVDYRNTQGFDRTGFDSSGAVAGLGWNSVYLISLGTQYKLNESWTLRAGYTFGNNPIPNSLSLFNVGSASIDEHTLYVGASYQINKSLMMSVSYSHSFENSIRGPLLTPSGAVPGTSIESTVAVDSVVFGATVKF